MLPLIAGLSTAITGLAVLALGEMGALGLCMVAVGLSLGAVALYRRHRMISIINSASEDSHRLKFLLQPSWSWRGGYPIVVVASPDLSWDYSWKVFPDYPLPLNYFLPLLRYFSRTASSVRLDSSSQVQAEDGQPGQVVLRHRWVLLRGADHLLFPMSRAEPITSLPIRTEEVNAKETDLAYNHGQLLDAYAELLNSFSLLPRLIRPPGKRGGMPSFAKLRTLLCWRSLVRIHVEHHIHRQLRQLWSAYTRRQFVINSSAEHAHQERHNITRLQKQCKQLDESLSNAARTASIVGLITILVALVPIMIKINPAPPSTLFHLLLGNASVYILLTGMAAVVANADAFRCKRQLFGANSLAGLNKGELAALHEGERASMSIYALEDKVFGIIRQPKRAEFATDLWACAALILIWTICLIQWLRDPANSANYISFISTAVFIGWPILALARVARRRQRRNAKTGAARCAPA